MEEALCTQCCNYSNITLAVPVAAGRVKLISGSGEDKTLTYVMD